MTNHSKSSDEGQDPLAADANADDTAERGKELLAQLRGVLAQASDNLVEPRVSPEEKDQIRAAMKRLSGPLKEAERALGELAALKREKGEALRRRDELEWQYTSALKDQEDLRATQEALLRRLEKLEAASRRREQG